MAHYTIDGICTHPKLGNKYIPGDGAGSLAIADTSFGSVYGGVKKTKEYLVYAANCRSRVISISYIPSVFI
jgi:hypothetical protein